MHKVPSKIKGEKNIDEIFNSPITIYIELLEKKIS